jgi:hypothetical protein
MRTKLGALAVLALACANTQPPTTITVRVDVPTGPPVTAAFLGVTLSPFGDGGASFLYDTSSHPTLDAGGRTFVIILPDGGGETFEVAVEALAALPDDDAGSATAPLGRGEASVTTVPHQDVEVTVHLSPPTM